MVTIAILNWFLDLTNNIFLTLFNPIHDFIQQLSTKIIALSIPSTIYDIFAVGTYFLPMGTVLTLLSITAMLISISIVLSFIRFILHFGGTL